MTTTTRRDFIRNLAPASGAALGLAALSLPDAFAQTAPNATAAPLPGVFDVRNFGAKGDGAAKDTAAIQSAIDACSRAGGGLVLLPAGRYLTGTVTLKDNVTLHLAPAATLLGSTDRADYPAKPFPARDLDIGGFEVWALVYAEGAHNIAIEGSGTIDGSGKDFPPLPKIQPLNVASGPRPRAIFLKNCRRVALRDFHLRNSACWSVHLACCDGVLVDGLDVFSEFYVQQDGVILDSSRNVRVANCRINTIDDCIVFKTSFPQPCEAITVTNCVVSGESSGIKFGTQSLGDFRAISISNCVIHTCRLGGLKFETMDGGALEDVTVSNIAMIGVTAPIFFRIGNRGQDFGFKDVQRPRPIGVLRNVLVTGIRATLNTQTDWTRTNGEVYSLHKACTMIIAGLPGHPVENVTISDIEVTIPGGGTAEEAAIDNIPEKPQRYPENDMFDVLPAWGFYVRHARGVTLNNIRLTLVKPDLRPAFIADDVSDLDLNGFTATATGAAHFIRLRNTPGALIRNSRPLGEVDAFLHVAGDQRTKVALLANDLRRAKQTVVKAEGSAAQISESGNLQA